MSLPHIVTMLVARDKTWVTTVFEAVHLIIIRDSDVVVAKKAIHAVVNRIAVISAVGHAAILTSVPVEVTAFPIG